jgi:hypothetical protein
VEGESPLPHLQTPTGCPYPEPEQSTQPLPTPHGVFIFFYKIIYMPIMLILNGVVNRIINMGIDISNNRKLHAEEY